MPKASFYLPGLRKILNDTVSLSSDTLRVALMNENYVFDPVTEFFDTGDNDTADPSFNDLVATGYTHKDISGSVITDFDTNTNGRVLLTFSDKDMGALGGAVNDTVQGAIIYKYTGSLTTSTCICWIPLTTAPSGTPTNGQNINLDFLTIGEGGQIQIYLPSQA